MNPLPQNIQALANAFAKSVWAAGIGNDVMVNVANYLPMTITSPSATNTSTVATMGTLLCPVNGGVSMTWDPKATGKTLENTIIDSADGKGFAGNVCGAKVTLNNVQFKDLYEGFHYAGCTDLTIIGGKQIGKVSGRCHFFLDVTNLNWTGAADSAFGPASTQSPVRFSAPGVRGGTVKGVHVTQVGSSFPIACWAIHAASNVNFIDCISEGGEFSFDSAGDAVGDAVTGCTVTNLTVINSKFHIGAIASNCHVNGGNFSNRTGECISLNCGSGVVIDGVVMRSTKHGIKFYSPSNTIIRNCTLYAPAGTPIIDGGTPQNDGGGNKLVVTP